MKVIVRDAPAAISASGQSRSFESGGVVQAADWPEELTTRAPPSTAVVTRTPVAVWPPMLLTLIVCVRSSPDTTGSGEPVASIVTSAGAAPAAKHGENSDVSFDVVSVAVAVTTPVVTAMPESNANVPLPLPSVMAVVEPRYAAP